MGRDNYTITVVATEEPVSLTEALDFCRVDQNSPDEGLVEILIKAATLQCEKYTNRVFIERTFLGEFDCLQATRFETYPFIELRRGPFKSLTSITIESGGSPVAISDVLTKDTPSYARLLFTESLDIADVVAYPLQATFVAGYGEAAAVPEDIKLAIKQAVLFWYENRGDVGTDDETPVDFKLPSVSMIILHSYRIKNTFGG